MLIPVVENPARKRKKRRTYTAKQRAAGFGGKRRVRRRRNPALATLAANPRRRRRTVAAYYRPRRRRRNPSLGKIGGMLNLNMAVGVTAGIIVGKISPRLIQKVWAGVPVTGIGGYAVRIGGTLAVAYVARMVTKSDRLAVGIVTGGVASVLYDLANTHILPRIGLAGVGFDSRYMTVSDLQQIGLSGYQVEPGRLSGYLPHRVTDVALAA